MGIGLDCYTLTERRYDAQGLLRFATRNGLEGLQFLDASRIDPLMDPGAIRAFRAQATELGLYLEVGIPSPNPFRHLDSSSQPMIVENLVEILTPYLQGAAELGVSATRTFLGDRHDRFRPGTSWLEQIQASMKVIRGLEPVLRHLGLRIAIETHADLTVVELLRILEELGPEITAVTLDTGNLLMRLDDPMEAVRKLAPWTACTHVKDAVLAFTQRGLCWQARPVGYGVVPLREMLTLLRRSQPQVNLSIELHPRIYDLPIFNPSWLNHFFDLSPLDLAQIIQYAVKCERAFTSHELQRPEDVEAIPWLERDLTWIRSSIHSLRSIITD